MHSFFSRTKRAHVLFVLALVAGLIAASISEAAPRLPSGSVALSSTNRIDFLNLGRSGGEKAWCRIRNTRDGLPAVGFVRKDPRLKKNIWRNIDAQIKEIQQKRGLTVALRRKQVRALQQTKTKLLAKCSAAIVTPTPTASPEPTNTPTPTPTVTPTSTPLPTLARWRAGGPGVIDPEGNAWEADTTGLVAATTNYRILEQPAIGGTDRDWLYWTVRQGPELKYRFINFDGQTPYDVVLHFAEFSRWVTGPGQRVFDIVVEGVPVRTAVDIFQEVGLESALVIMIPSMLVTDGELNIDVLPASGSANPPSIAALEVRPHVTGSETEADDVYRFDCGVDGAEISEPGVGLWDDDGFFIFDGSRETLFDPSTAIAGTTDDVLFQTERYGYDFDYVLGAAGNLLPNGLYEVNLYFAEMILINPGQRVFNVSIEGSPILENYDIAADVGPATGTIKTFLIAVSDGQLNIHFQRVVNYAKVSAISVRPVS